MILTAAALRLLPWGRITIGLAFLAVVGAGIGWHVHRVDLARTQGTTAGKAEVRAEWDKATIEDQQFAARVAAERRTIEQQRQADQRTEVQNAQEAIRMARSDADLARIESDRLRVAAKAAGARCSARSGNPAPATGSASAPIDGSVLADVLGEVVTAGAAMAEEADRRGIAGAACERLYEGLR